MKVHINGRFVPAAEASISVFDHSLLFGDGVFEGLRSYAVGSNGYVFKLREHLDRLYESARAILLKVPLELERMEQAVLETFRVNGLREGYGRLIVTRGVGDLGLDVQRCQNGSVIIIAQEWPALYGQEAAERGMRAIVSAIRNKPIDGLPPTIKSLSYLTNIMAMIEAKAKGATEAIMLDAQGYVSEGSGDNVFIVRRGQLYTPPTVHNLAGITRQTVIELAAEGGFVVREENFGLAALYAADEVFVTGTAAEVAPVTQVDGRVVGDGRPGPVTRELQERFVRLVRSDRAGTPIYRESVGASARG